ncbi:MAG TPA: hypothetical protein VJ808_14075 [Gemmatimonadales bacterium]|nr:hypothetical protein [Gemmatimonadales bacterium]
MKRFAPAEYLLDISDFTADPTSIIPLPVNRSRATHSTYPVDVTVATSTNREANLAPWGLGANFVEFEAGSAGGTLELTFQGTGSVEWRVMVALLPKSGGGAPTVTPMTLQPDGSGSLEVSGFGTRWSKAVLMPGIADQSGAEVPYAYGAVLD